MRGLRSGDLAAALLVATLFTVAACVPPSTGGLPTGLTSPVPASTDPPPTVAPSGATAPPSCGPFATPLHDLEPDDNGRPTDLAGSGCGNAMIPATGIPSALAAGWVLATSYTCSGPGGMSDNTIDFVVHDTTTGADLRLEGVSSWSYGVSALGESPAGSYILRVVLPHPDLNQCQWRVAAYTGSGH